jgi:cytochrome c oxidase assembly protein subunit 19
MSGGAFGGARGYQPRAPEKGVFPLDHFGECKAVKEEYMECLRRHAGDADACQDAAKRYLKCRMERNLMAQQDLKELGFGESRPASAPPPAAQRKEAAGFVAGLSKFDKS